MLMDLLILLIQDAAPVTTEPARLTARLHHDGAGTELVSDRQCTRICDDGATRDLRQ